MIQNTIYPSHHYPDYFKMDLGLGLKQVHPIALSLDSIFGEIAHLSSRVAFSIIPSCLPDEEVEKALEYHGFLTTHLNDNERVSFLSDLPEIFTHLGTLRSIWLLAQIYFPNSQVRRGYDIVASDRKRPQTQFRLVSKDAINSVVLVRIQSPSSREKIDEFINNTRLLLPEGMHCEIGPPLVPATLTKTKIRLLSNLKLNRRRL